MTLRTVLLVFISFIHPIEAIFFGGIMLPATTSAPPAAESSSCCCSQPAPSCCPSQAPPQCGGGGGGCGGGSSGCGGCATRLFKRSIMENATGPLEPEIDDCHSPILREAIEESLTFQLPSSIRKLSVRLLKADLAHHRYVGFCSLVDQSHKFFAHSKNYCAHGNQQITCTVFQE
ncbi:hypothetical protein QR680_007541 [Steinernema hermaphroditum]|uniref:Ground-like domain-containing protein n=1 Tax=Steinernema hermaphroditum TaxID=289476 RepID=A0AA39M6K0_9BILA|nr:hypothetical protein QR680_007541 [Steinernema hermaphroditum]